MLQGAGHGPGSHVAMSPAPTGEKVVGPAPWALWDIGASTGKTQGEKTLYCMLMHLMTHICFSSLLLKCRDVSWCFLKI